MQMWCTNLEKVYNSQISNNPIQDIWENYDSKTQTYKQPNINKKDKDSSSCFSKEGLKQPMSTRKIVNVKSNSGNLKWDTGGTQVTLSGRGMVRARGFRVLARTLRKVPAILWECEVTVSSSKSWRKVELLHDSAIRFQNYICKIKYCFTKSSAQQFEGTLLTMAQSRHNSNMCAK